jgi:integrase
VIRLKWDAVDFDRGELHVARVKNGKPGTHPLSGRELRMLRRLKREQDPGSSFVFASGRGAPFARRGFRQMSLHSYSALGEPDHCPPTWKEKLPCVLWVSTESTCQCT